MKNIIKILSGVLFVSLLFSSCNQDQIGTKLDSNFDTGVGFLQTSQTVRVDPTAATNIFEFEVARGSVKTAASYNITVTTEYASLVTIPSSVSFEAGSASAKLACQFDAELMEPGGSYTFKIEVESSIEEGNISLSPTIILTVGLVLNWEDVGEGIFTCPFFYSGSFPLTLQKVDGIEFYRIVDAILEGNYFEFSVDNNIISFADQFTGYTHATYGRIYIEEHGYAASVGLNVREGNAFKFGVNYYDPDGYWFDPDSAAGVQSMTFVLN